MSDTFTLELSEGTRILKMPFGLLNVLCSVVQDIEGVGQLALDNDLREEVLIQTLSPRTSEGLIAEGSRFNLFSLDASPENVGALLTWVQEHLFDFFLKAAVSAQKQVAEAQQRLDGSKPSSNGGAA